MIFLCFAVLLASALTVTGGRNMHGKCSISINEVFLGDAKAFIEISKLCKDNEVNTYKKLGGHVLLMLNVTDLSVIKLFWLHEKLMKPADIDEAASVSSQVGQKSTEQVTTQKTLDSSASADKPTSLHQKNTERSEHESASVLSTRGQIPSEQSTTQKIVELDGMIETTAADHEKHMTASELEQVSSLSSSVDGNGLSVDLFKEISCMRNPFCKSDKSSKRQRRSIESIQTKARYFYVIEFDYDPPAGYVIAYLLLKLEDKEAKTWKSVSAIFPEGQQLSTLKLDKVIADAVDVLVITDSASGLEISINDIVPASRRGSQPILMDAKDKSLSKCDDSVQPMQFQAFIATVGTPWKPNICSGNEALLEEIAIESGEEDKLLELPHKFKGVKLLRQAKELVINLWFNLLNNDDADLLKQNQVDVAAKLLNLGRSTVYDIIHQFRSGDKFSNSNKRNRGCPITDIDDDEKIILYQIITGFYKKNEIPKLGLMREEFILKIKENRRMNSETATTSPESDELSEYSCCSRSFATILNKNGYSYGRINSKDTAVHSPYVIQNRRKYLKRKSEVDANKAIKVLFQDETWIDPHQRPAYSWRQNPKLCTLESRYDFMFANYKSSRGGRIVVLGIGGEDGYLNCATEVYKVSKSKTSVDYHSNVNGKKFINWMEKVITCLPTGNKFVIVMDNCPFHNLKDAPDSKQKKADFLSWLKRKKREGYQGLPTNLDVLRRDQLWELVKEIRNQMPAIIDDMVSKAGHEILRLAPYSPEMNPIEYAWKDLKHHVRDKNKKQDINDAVSLALEYMQNYGGDKWRKHIGHCQKVEEMFRQGDAEYESFIRRNPVMHQLQPWDEDDEAEDDYEFMNPDDSVDVSVVVNDPSFDLS